MINYDRFVTPDRDSNLRVRRSLFFIILLSIITKPIMYGILSFMVEEILILGFVAFILMLLGVAAPNAKSKIFQVIGFPFRVFDYYIFTKKVKRY